MNKERLSVFVLGSGKAAKRHCDAFNKLDDLYEIVGSYINADIVDVCNAHYKHYPDTYLYLGKGKHVICEKPPAESLWELEDLHHKEVLTGKTMFPISQYRFVPFNVGSGLYVFRRDSGYYDINWRRNWSTAYGGAIVNQGYHVLDWYANQRAVKRVRCTLTPSSDPRVQVDAGASIELKLYGADTPINLTIVAGPGMTPTEFGDSDLGYMRQFEKIYYSIVKEDEDPVPRAELRNTIELITACYYSGFNDGAEVKLPLFPEHPAYRGWTSLALQRLLQQGSSLQKP